MKYGYGERVCVDGIFHRKWEDSSSSFDISQADFYAFSSTTSSFSSPTFPHSLFCHFPQSLPELCRRGNPFCPLSLKPLSSPLMNFFTSETKEKKYSYVLERTLYHWFGGILAMVHHGHWKVSGLHELNFPVRQSQIHSSTSKAKSNLIKKR